MTQDNHRTRHRKKTAAEKADLQAELDQWNRTRPGDQPRSSVSQIVPMVTGAAVGFNAAQFATQDPICLLMGTLMGAAASEQYFKSHTPTQWTGANGVVSYAVMTGNGVMIDDPMVTAVGGLFFLGAANRMINGVNKKSRSPVLSKQEERKFQTAFEHALYKAGRPAQYPVEFFLATTLLGSLMFGAEGTIQLAEKIQTNSLALDDETIHNLAEVALVPIGYHFARPLYKHHSIAGQEDDTKMPDIDESRVMQYMRDLWPQVAEIVKEKQDKLAQLSKEKPMLVPSLWGAAGGLLFAALGQYASGIAGLGNSYITSTINPDKTGRER